jgi:hypothetical protein
MEVYEQVKEEEYEQAQQQDFRRSLRGANGF